MDGIFIKTGKNIRRSAIIEQIFNSPLLVSDEEDLKYGLGEMKPYYCKGDYIRLDENGNITSKSR